MLVIISDLHLTDGTSGSTISTGAFEIFVERLRDLAFSASQRTDGSYRPIERIDLLMLGDVLDVVRSVRWVGSNIRPWDNPQKPEFVSLISQITGDILKHNDEALARLRGLSTERALTLPPANARGQAVLGTEEVPVNLKIHYMVGNHDWFFHLPGPSYDLLRQSLVRQMGLANRPNVPFPHDSAESPELQEVLRRHRVCARHGDIYDPFNYEGDRDASSLGDAIIIELINRFPFVVEQRLGNDLPLATTMGLKEIDNVRPVLLVPVWIDGVLQRTCPIVSIRKQVKKIWDELADQFLQCPFVRARDTWNPADLVDGLEELLKFSKRLSLGWASKIANWLLNLRGQQEESYYRHALTEQDFRNRRSRHVVYGHTHGEETVPLDASYADGFVLYQTYFNSGTWRRVFRQTQFAPGEHEFSSSDVMTYLAFFQGDERKGRPYETWSGTLGIQPTESTIHRIDPGGSSALRRENVSPPALRGQSPHFQRANSRSPIIPTRRV